MAGEGGGEGGECNKPEKHISVGEGEEKQRDQGERKDEKRKTAMLALLVFIMAFGYT